MTADILNWPYMSRGKKLSEYPNRVRFWREQANRTQSELGDAVGLSKVQISRVELGTRDLHFAYARRIANFLGVTAADLLPEEDNPLAADPLLREINENYQMASDEGRNTIAAVAESSAKYRAGPKILPFVNNG